MLNDLNFLSLKENGFLPSDCQELSEDLVNSNLVKFSEKDSVNSSKEDFGIIVDNYQWVASSKATKVIYSCDGKFVYGYSNVSEEEGEYIKYLLKNRLIPINKIKINRRNDKMSQNANDIKNRIEEMRKKQEGRNANTGASIEDSAAFAAPVKREMSEEDKLKAAEKDAKIKDLTKAIKTLSSGIELRDTTDLYAYNQPRSSIIGWITDRDVRLHAKAEAKVIPDPVTGKPRVKENAPQDVKDLLAQGKKPAREFLEETVQIKVNQMAPGAAKFAIVEMPVDGIVPINKLRDPNFQLELDFKSTADKVIKFYNKKEFVATVISLLGGSIKENPKTHTEPSIINAFLKGKPVTDKETGRTENRLTPAITVTSKRKLITPTNYFPKTVFATLRLDELTTQEKIDQANLSLFGHLFKSVAGNPTPFSKLDASEKAKLSKEEGRIVSKFFDPNESLPLDVKSVFTGATIANPLIPIKEEKLTKDGKNTRLVPVTYDVTRSVEDPYGIDPFNDERFAKILDACGGQLTREVIANLYSKSKKTKKTSGASGIILTPEEATKIYLNAASVDEDGNNSALKNIQFSDALSHDELKDFSDDALRSFSSYYAK